MKQFKRYFLTKLQSLPSIIFFTIILIFLALLGIILAFDANPNFITYNSFDESSDNLYASSNVVGIDEYVIHAEKQAAYYFMFVDEYGDYGTVIMSSGNDPKLKEQFQFFNDYFIEKKEVDPPQPVKLSGVVRKLTQNEMDLFVDVYDTTQEEFTSVIGSYILDTTVSTTSPLTLYTYLVIAGIYVLFYALLLISRMTKLNTIRKYYRFLYLTNHLEHGQEALKDKNSMVIVNEHILASKKDVVAVPIERILWIYEWVSNKEHYLQCYVDGLPTIQLLKHNKDRQLYIQHIFESLQRYRPDILIGYSEENRQKYEELKNSKSAKQTEQVEQIDNVNQTEQDEQIKQADQTEPIEQTEQADQNEQSDRQ